MAPVISFVGKSGSGKTTFLEKLIAELAARGLSVCAVKHSPHGFSLEEPGKDSERFRKAGSARTILHGKNQVVVFAEVPEDLDLGGLTERFAKSADIVVAEGYKSGPGPKVEVSRAECSTELVCAGSEDLIAVVADHPVDVDVPVFKMDDVSALADFLMERLPVR